MAENIHIYSEDQPEDLLNYTESLQKTKEGAKIIQRFIAFIKPIWSLMLFGFLLGLGLTIGEEILKTTIKDPTFWTIVGLLIMKETGIGLIVAAIAVFGYEYTHRVRGDFERQLEQQAALVSLDKAVGKLEVVGESRDFMKVMTDDITVVLSDSFDRVGERILDRKFSSDVPVEKELKETLKGLADKLVKLKERNTGYNKAYFEFITWLTQDVVQKNARALTALSSDVVDVVTVDFDLPTSKSIAGQIFGLLLRSLKPGGSYQTISNVLFWEGKDLEFFWKETEKVCNNQIKVQRLFNLRHFRNYRNLDNKFEIAKKILEDHNKLQTDTNKGYEIRFLIPSVEDIAAQTHVLTRGNAYLPTFSIGVFNCNNESNPDYVAFEAEDEQLSNISFTRNAINIRHYQEIFKTLWNLSENVENPFESDIEKFKKIIFS